MIIDLEFCPFCGNSKTVIDIDVKPSVMVCRNCGARGPEVHEKTTFSRSEDDYVRLAWNKRPGEAAMDARIRDLEHKLRNAAKAADMPFLHIRHKKFPWGREWDLQKFKTWSDSQEVDDE